ncbi:MAG TPA: avidin/streptavidin family protein [Xanthobacteraceae bacterium]|nr:avidin/streptavidin family protein [Xanthobacteraceae bacterium]
MSRAALPAHFAQGLTVPSYWKNQRGSEMLPYSIDGKGAFTGAFINHAAGFACENSPYDLHGQVHANSHLRFTVVWKNLAQDCKSHLVVRTRGRQHDHDAVGADVSRPQRRSEKNARYRYVSETVLDCAHLRIMERSGTTHKLYG